MNFITRNTAATMVCTFASGITFAGPTRGSANLHLLALAALVTATPARADPPASADLQVTISGLRSTKGQVMMCLTRRSQKQFLKCADDPSHVTKVLKASAAGRVDFRLPPGEYSLLLVHDENGNGRMDKMMGMPREGFGFSRNAPLHMGPPRYEDVHFTVAPGRNSQAIKVRYML
ncbi:DUF2141 domain-containing protein [Sphingomonas edaphi]|uniref:DUF2141 domain-containing protein n=1 Tax=Sphingomonas edaphi TaxID=2315689 RepID=A0A418Q038_9SPHN|nr:DUF2141 domain-containing protein [Sphingomonas edaphi]